MELRYNTQQTILIGPLPKISINGIRLIKADGIIIDIGILQRVWLQVWNIGTLYWYKLTLLVSDVDKIGLLLICNTFDNNHQMFEVVNQNFYDTKYTDKLYNELDKVKTSVG